MLADELMEPETEDAMAAEASTAEPKWTKPNRFKAGAKPGAKAGTRPGSKLSSEPARSATRTCRHCNRKGHIQRDCPDNEER
jgi:hypothetical protein